MSRDVKEFTIKGVNDGLEKGISRAKCQLLEEIKFKSEQAVCEATNRAAEMTERTRKDILGRLECIQNDMDERIEREQRIIGARIDNNARQLNRRLANIEQQHTESLTKMRNQLYDAIDAQGKEMKHEVERLDHNINILANGLRNIEGNMLDLQRDMNTKFDVQQQQINTLNANVQTLYDSKKNDENEKMLAAGAALAILDAIKERSPIKRFAPQYMQEEVAFIENRLRNIKNNPSSCTVSDANILMDKALVMENEALRTEAQWQVHFDLAVRMADSILLMMAEENDPQINSIYEEVTDDEKISLQTDYWTHGAYDALRKEIEQIKKRINSKEPDITEFETIIDKLQQLEVKAAQMREQAANLGILSEERVAVTNDILNSMLASGWELKDAPGYLGGEKDDEDMREGTFAVLKKNVSNEELSILILPEQQGDKVKNKIVVHRNDDKPESGMAFMSRMNEIKKEIEKSGHKVGDVCAPACGGDGKILELCDAQSLGKSGSSNEIKKALGRVRN